MSLLPRWVQELSAIMGSYGKNWWLHVVQPWKPCHHGGGRRMCMLHVLIFLWAHWSLAVFGQQAVFTLPWTGATLVLNGREANGTKSYGVTETKGGVSESFFLSFVVRISA